METTVICTPPATRQEMGELIDSAASSTADTCVVLPRPLSNEDCQEMRSQTSNRSMISFFQTLRLRGGCGLDHAFSVSLLSHEQLISPDSVQCWSAEISFDDG